MNAVSLSLSSGFNFTRESKPNAKGVVKTTVRDLLGLIASGSRDERNNATTMLVAHYWNNGQFRPLAGQLSRVFGAQVVDFGAAIGLDMVTGTAAEGSIADKLGNRESWAQVFAGIYRAHTAKPFKGEKLLFVNAIAAAEKAYADAAAVAAAEREAGLDANTVDAESTTEVPTLALTA